MPHVHTYRPLGENDYLRQEAAADVKHKPASKRHRRIAGNAFTTRATSRAISRDFMANMKPTSAIQTQAPPVFIIVKQVI